ncbi:MAG: T9SS type A sorting domain-containing protein [Dysgonamonadaceae bacterium]|jgi:hypothetical protein|nr:T9SS type A sorting domain-containing protein [Dysgonamonadaceae bacterium]
MKGKLELRFLAPNTGKVRTRLETVNEEFTQDVRALLGKAAAKVVEGNQAQFKAIVAEGIINLEKEGKIKFASDAHRASVTSISTDFFSIFVSSTNVYPNPVTESFRINGITAPTKVIITDLSGRIVLQQTVEGGEYVAAGNLPKGVYIVRAGGKTLKVVKR